MQRLTLTRNRETPLSTSGELFNERVERVAYTLELPWRGNAQSRSRIPPGEYLCRIRYSPKFKCQLYEVGRVPGREHILFHAGNYPKDTDGCILLGRTRSKDAVWYSKETLTNFMDGLGKEPFLLTILDFSEGL